MNGCVVWLEARRPELHAGAVNQASAVSGACLRLPCRLTAPLCTCCEQVKDLGEGASGVAVLMRDKGSGELLAVKYIPRGDKVRRGLRTTDSPGAAHAAARCWGCWNWLGELCAGTCLLAPAHPHLVCGELELTCSPPPNHAGARWTRTWSESCSTTRS